MSLVFGGDAPEIPGQGMDAAVTNAAISGEAIGGHGNGSSFYIRSNAAMAAHKESVRDMSITPMMEYFFHNTWLEQ